MGTKDNKKAFKAVLTCISSILDVIVEHKILLSVVIELLNYIEAFVGNIIKSFSEEVEDIHWKVETVIIWIKTSIGLIRDRKRLILEHYIHSQEVVNIIQGSIKFILVAGTQRTDSIISNTSNMKIDELLNRMKAKCFDMIDAILNLYDAKYEITAFFGLLTNILPMSFNSLLSVCINDYDMLETVLNNETSNEIIACLLNFLSKILNKNELTPFVEQHRSKLIVEVILVLLKSTNKEKSKLIEEPEDFVDFTLDACDNQSSGMIKTNAAMLLKKLCDHIEGSLFFTVTFCCEAIRSCSLTKPESTFIYENTSLFLKRSTPEEIIETCLLALSVLHKLVIVSKDLLPILEDTLIKAFDYVFESSSLLVNCRAALMLRYYAQSLFQNKHRFFVNSIEFLVKGLMLDTTNKAFTIQCADSLGAIIVDQDIIDRVEAFINRLLTHFTLIIAQQTLPQFFSMLISILSSYSEAMDAKIVPLFNALSLRLQTEIAGLKPGNKNSLTIINQCWNAINCIYEDNAFHPDYTESFEKSLIPMFNLFANTDRIEFEDDLVQIISTIVKKFKGVSENMVGVFPLLLKYFEKTKCDLDKVFEALNYYLVYGKEQFMKRKEWIEAILKISEVVLFKEYEPGSINHVEAAVLLQAILQTLGGGVMDLYIPGIVKLIIKRLEISPITDALVIELHNAFLCSICNNCPLTLHSAEMNLEWLIVNILNTEKTHKERYSRKVLVIGLANILVNGNLPVLADKYYAKILELIVNTLQQQDHYINMNLDEENKRESITLEDTKHVQMACDENQLQEISETQRLVLLKFNYRFH